MKHFSLSSHSLSGCFVVLKLWSYSNQKINRCTIFRHYNWSKWDLPFGYGEESRRHTHAHIQQSKAYCMQWTGKKQSLIILICSSISRQMDCKNCIYPEWSQPASQLDSHFCAINQNIGKLKWTLSAIKANCNFGTREKKKPNPTNNSSISKHVYISTNAETENTNDIS